MRLVSVVMHERILFDGSSTYGHYQVVDGSYAGRPARVLYSDNDAAQSGMALDGSKELLFDYNQRFLELLRGLNPKHVLLLGGGAFTLPAALQRELPSTRLDVVELDPTLLDIAAAYFAFRQAALTRVYLGDGIDYLRQASARYDAIVVDVYVHERVPLAFQSALTARQYRRSLNPGGLVAANVIGSYYGHHESPALQCQISAFRTAFRDVQIFPASLHLPLWIPQNFIIIGQAASRTIHWVHNQPVRRHYTSHAYLQL